MITHVEWWLPVQGGVALHFDVAPKREPKVEPKFDPETPWPDADPEASDVRVSKR